MASLLLVLNEGQQVSDRGRKLILRAEEFAGMVESHAGSIQQSMRLRERFDNLGSKTVSLERDDIDAPRSGGGAVDQHVGRHIMQHSTQPTHETVIANRRVVMDSDAAG